MSGTTFRSVAAAMAAVISVSVLFSLLSRLLARPRARDAAAAGVAAAPALSTKKDIHLLRKLQHVTSGLVILALSTHDPLMRDWRYAVGTLVFSSAGMWATYALRRAAPRFDQWFRATFAPIMRPRELTRMPGAFFFLLGCAAALTLFPKPRAHLAILFLSFGDPAASFVGVTYARWAAGGRRSSPKGAGGDGQSSGKTVAGSLGCFAVCALCTAWALGGAANTATHIIIGGLAGAIAELVPFSSVDDNLAIPIVAGTILTLASSGGGWFPSLQG
jgi:diacylglycerol kinase (CTP)